jgi:hypothetical protein
VERVSVKASPEPVSVELLAELVRFVGLVIVEFSEELVASEDVELVRLVQHFRRRVIHWT